MPRGSLALGCQLWTSKDLAEELLRDKVFPKFRYGYYSLSGGEPLIHPEFALDELKICYSREVISKLLAFSALAAGGAP